MGERKSHENKALITLRTVTIVNIFRALKAIFKLALEEQSTATYPS